MIMMIIHRCHTHSTKILHTPVWIMITFNGKIIIVNLVIWILKNFSTFNCPQESYELYIQVSSVCVCVCKLILWASYCNNNTTNWIEWNKTLKLKSNSIWFCIFFNFVKLNRGKLWKLKKNVVNLHLIFLFFSNNRWLLLLLWLFDAISMK